MGTYPVQLIGETEFDELIETVTDIRKENLQKVLIHNDESTPMDFVIVILIRIFEITPVFAEHIMWTAHSDGIALVQVLPKTEAERRVGKAHFAARLEGFPLTFTIEPDD